MKYSLAKYIVTISPSDDYYKEFFGEVIINGTKSYQENSTQLNQMNGDAVDSIEVSIQNDLWSTQAYATGAWVHNKNLSKTGTVNLSLSQLAYQVAKLKSICQNYYNNNYDDPSFIITITENSAGATKQVCQCIDCLPTKIPQQSFGSTASNQTWSFTSGEITFNEE